MSIKIFSNKKVLLLDMNSTFMFGEDRFGKTEDFSLYYNQIGGSLSNNEINSIIKTVYAYLDTRYPDEQYRHCFPSLEYAINQCISIVVDKREIDKIISTFSFHEIGYIPPEYVTALHKLNQKYKLAVVIDIWSPKMAWLNLFKELGINKLFMASSFSSDHGIVKPSPKPFELVMAQLGIKNTNALVIGDSIRRDLGGARAAEIDCVLVGGAEHPDAIGSYANLLKLSDAA